MSKLLLLLLTYIFTQVSIAQTNDKKFEIRGQVSGMPDSTIIYLDTINSVKGIVVSDSTYVINQRFHFSGFIKDSVSQVILRTKNFQDYKFLWLENAVINFSATKGKFRSGSITGSKTQIEQDLYDSTAGNDRNRSFNFIKSHPNSIISAYILSVYASSWGKDTASMLYYRLTEKMKKTSYGKDINEFIILNKNPKVGESYVDFTQENSEGKNVSLSDFVGKVVLLDFWGSWCGPCRENNVELVKIYNEFKSKAFEILGVAADGDKKAWLEAIKKDGMIWPNVTDFNGPKNKAAIIYGISKYPTNYLINKKGILVGMDLYGDDLRTRIREVIAEVN